MKIIQVVAGYSKGDGVGNVVIAMNQLLKKAGYDTEIYNQSLSYKDIDSEMFGEENIILYHLALQVDPFIPFLHCRKILIFHNITAPELLVGRGLGELRISCSAGLYDTGNLSPYFDSAIAFSDYSKMTLVRLGWEEDKVFVLPIIVRLENFDRRPAQNIIKEYGDGKKNIIFTGRIFPNKKQEEIIAAFASYKKKYHEQARLFLIGKPENRYYYAALIDYARKLGVEQDVIFPGHVSFGEYLSYYHLADLFLCMSAHEGFCIPLVEAMYFHIPILAVNSTAVPDTLNGSGVLLESREPEEVSEKMNLILSDPDFRERVIEGEAKRLEELSCGDLEKQYMLVLNKCIKDALASGRKSNVRREPFLLSCGVDYEIIDYDTKLAQKEPVVIYGMGNAGRKLYKSLKASGLKITCVCDRSKKEMTDLYAGCEILLSQEAVEKYKDGNFIVSVQDRRNLADIILYLLQEGIDQKRIFVFDEKQSKVR